MKSIFLKRVLGHRLLNPSFKKPTIHKRTARKSALVIVDESKGQRRDLEEDSSAK